MRRDAPRPNRVLPLLMLVALAAWLGLVAVSVAPNRIVPGTGFRAHEVVGWAGALGACLPPLAVAVLAWHPSPARLRHALVLIVLLLMALPAWLGLAATRLVDPELPQARLGLGSAFWVLLFLLLLALIELRSRLALSRLVGWVLLVPVLLAWWLALASWLEPLALLQEYRARSDQFATAVWHHLALVGAAVGASLVIGVALALLMRPHAGLQRAGFGVLNFLQTIPSLALFGLLLAPLAWLGANVEWLAALGVRGIGWAPALLALIGYSLLPMVRNTFVALEGVDPAVIESARGMGMSRRQVFLQVRLPLALPVILEGVRITTVQAIGLTAVAALIGAGGLGGFIFQGLGQAAMDLVLLGALPILVMALVADALLGALSERLHPGGAR
ncbi:ABC transporter permease [Halomonas heilongjiangensis]|uniref:ABC transporter permease n=1 Tax=Halomonas heilongjiangensis TaxID=1387883 RepID=A0A2N7TMB0_9GAMM|nr:ABC transporter permease [Halomonas heilongjiangensis]PMR69319.1 ABC transporter permease [Halomonas heilongjiangensis]PXX90676.1 ABC transporter permease [Halomonas heilongjiangensis]